MKIRIESKLILCIGALDLVTTMIWVCNNGAQEANPLFQHYLNMGPSWFALIKIVLLLAPVFLLEWARRRRPQFAMWGSRFAIAAYLALYVVGVSRLNPDLLMGNRQQTAFAAMSSHLDDVADMKALVGDGNICYSSGESVTLREGIQ